MNKFIMKLSLHKEMGYIITLMNIHNTTAEPDEPARREQAEIIYPCVEALIKNSFCLNNLVAQKEFERRSKAVSRDYFDFIQKDTYCFEYIPRKKFLDYLTNR